MPWAKFLPAARRKAEGACWRRALHGRACETCPAAWIDRPAPARLGNKRGLRWS